MIADSSRAIGGGNKLGDRRSDDRLREGDDMPSERSPNPALGRRGLLAAMLALAACEGDPIPIVEDTPPAGSERLQLTAGGGGSPRSGGRENDYRLGANDRLRITVFGQPTLTGEYTLDGNGSLAFPLIGEVKADGMTTNELQRAIATKLEPDYLVNPSISAEVLTRRPFYVIGEVQKPGNYPYVTDMTALNAVAIAGGFTYRAKTTQFYLKRLNQDGRMVRIVARPDTLVRPGDTLEVRERYF
jgi:polysaccharide export outer membrane protein